MHNKYFRNTNHLTSLTNFLLYTVHFLLAKNTRFSKTRVYEPSLELAREHLYQAEKNIRDEIGEGQNA